jgi:type II secretory pathway component PulK
MRDSQAQQLLESRKQQRFNTPDEFLKQLAAEGLQPPSVAISVNSEYFLLQTQADLGEVHASLRSLLFRGISATVAIQRSLGEW